MKNAVDPRLQRLLNSLPNVVRRSYLWLMKLGMVWVRVPVGVLFIIFGFLPILGFWMIPIGALLLGQDVPPVQRAVLFFIGRVQEWWDRFNWRRTNRPGCEDGPARSSGWRLPTLQQREGQPCELPRACRHGNESADAGCVMCKILRTYKRNSDFRPPRARQIGKRDAVRLSRQKIQTGDKNFD
jgi:hypothetical protein